MCFVNLKIARLVGILSVRGGHEQDTDQSCEEGCGFFHIFTGPQMGAA
jgi:hypothetical protein